MSSKYAGGSPFFATVLVDPRSGDSLNPGDGLGGVKVTTNTAAITGSFTAIQVLEDATFSVFTEANVTGQPMTGFVVPSGLTLFGKITAYTLSSGKVRAYV